MRSSRASGRGSRAEGEREGRGRNLKLAGQWGTEEFLRLGHPSRNQVIVANDDSLAIWMACGINIGAMDQFPLNAQKGFS